MRAMLLECAGTPLVESTLPTPRPGPGEVLVDVSACGVCRTDLHIVDGDLTEPTLPIVLGHEIIGRVADLGPGVTGLTRGQRVGVPWLGHTCGHCDPCRSNRENLCTAAEFTGYTRHGGFAEQTVADARYCFPLAEAAGKDDAALAPLLCAGLIGYRSYRMAGGGTARRLGLYGFGAAAHILCQIATAQGCAVHAFTKPGDVTGQEFARDLGAVWAGGSDEAPPQPLDAAILFAPVGELVPAALRTLVPGGVVVCAGIHMSPIPTFDYDLLWHERSVRSVANLTRRDGEEFFALLETLTVETSVELHPLADANVALDRLRSGAVQGASVLVP